MILQKQYEYILIDSPPVAPVSDSVVLSTLVDGVLLVIDQKSTPRQLAQQAILQLQQAHAKTLGFVLNRVDPRTSAYAPQFQDYYK